MNISLIIFYLTLLLTVQLSVTQLNGSPLVPLVTPFQDVSIAFFKQFLDSIPVSGDVPDYELLQKVSGKAFNSKFFDTASQLGTIIASPLGPIASPYSLDVDKPSNNNNTYDYVIVGAGAAGSTVAARLTEDPNIRVLVIEAGGKENNFNVIPLFAFLQQKTPIDWGYYSVPQTRSAQGLNNKKIPASRGKVVGGSTSINFMLYVRGNPSDYDKWQELGATGWNYSAMAPYFVKMEDSRDPRAEPGYHGTKGPMPVSEIQDPYPVDEAFLEGCREYGLNIGDYNGADQMRFQYGSHYIRDGERWSTGRGYLAPASSRTNLDILLFSRATKIIFDDEKRAIGVKFTRNNENYQVFARSKVIISAGGIATPQLLMLSGIGPKDQLEKFKIPTVHESPGVGNNLQDHPFTFLLYKTNLGTSFVAPRLDTAKSIAEYASSHKGSFTTPGLNVNGFMRTKYAKDERSDIQILEFSYIIGGALPNFYLGYLLNFNRQTYFKYFLPYSGSDGTMYAVSLVKPRNTGTIKLASADPRDPPLIDFNFFTDPRDLGSMVEGCKLVLNITKTEAMQSVGAERFNSSLGDCDRYAFDSDDYLMCLTQTLTFTLWHSTSTARMGFSDDPLAVVSPDLHVYGVKDLMVIDTSVMPEVPTGNTATPTIALAERAADMIRGRVLRPQSLPFTDEDDIINDYVPYEIDD
ncbi:uncharacterized protein LOC107362155 [Tetranychus urticae]|uniref:Glucose-methanol-choline oxidoreductase N-terminal domain-containing protein n=1 Tax=Tetranychus urticae TaxID=32264 RepID=T1K8M4_TETUR|nr:uncharacterized protein LOC107362155 [Tetranychus urticae]